MWPISVVTLSLPTGVRVNKILKTKKKIIGGDWNLYMDPKKDKLGGIVEVKIRIFCQI